jgi:hypothetical protein
VGGNRKGEELVGRFFANPKVTAGKIVEGWSALTDAACTGRHVLIGLGPVKQGNAYGVLVHMR